MAKKRSTTPEPSVAQELAELRKAVDQLSQRVHVLIHALDDLCEEVQWRNNQARDRHGYRPPPMIVTSMPKDPLAPDFGERLNRFKPSDVPPDPPPVHSSRQPTLFE